MRNRDPKGYYAALNISPGASQQEIRLAYTFLKQAYKTRRKRRDPKVRQAYETLGDREQRKRYDEGRSSRVSLLTRRDGESRLHSVPLLVVALLVFLGILIQFLRRARSAVVRRRCVRCHRRVMQGQVYCADHFHESVDQAREEQRPGSS